ncbi:MAG TPA: molybdopterin molybdenumtransferase MoeA, partial [candidate division Zixibacteria bacterium]|nr:molybdopterin molybdenumtransferase MoeA [candidate division Zixibacteria bacterium]
TTFAVSDDSVVFGLPGNPVSSFVAFEILVKPFLFATMGHRYEPIKVIVPLGVEFSRRVARRDERIPVKFGDDGRVYPVEYHGSAHFQALIHADGLIMIPRGVHKIPAGEKVEVHLIRWN